MILRFDLCAMPYFLHLFPGPYRASVPGRLVLVGSDRTSRGRAVSRGSVHPRSEMRAEVGSGVWPGLLVREAIRRQARDRSERFGQRGGPESEASAVAPRPGLPVGDWIALLACHLGIWVDPGVYATSCAGPSLYWEVGP